MVIWHKMVQNRQHQSAIVLFGKKPNHRLFTSNKSLIFASPIGLLIALGHSIQVMIVLMWNSRYGIPNIFIPILKWMHFR